MYITSGSYPEIRHGSPTIFLLPCRTPPPTPDSSNPKTPRRREGGTARGPPPIAMARTKHPAVRKSKEQPKKKLQFGRSPHGRATPTGKPAPRAPPPLPRDRSLPPFSARGAKHVLFSSFCRWSEHIGDSGECVQAGIASSLFFPLLFAFF